MRWTALPAATWALYRSARRIIVFGLPRRKKPDEKKPDHTMRMLMLAYGAGVVR